MTVNRNDSTTSNVVVPVVTTPGNYQYIGRLEVEFNDQGVVTSFNGEP
ncbi:MAG: hypothetical protein F6J97_11655, partial [Leptolyngbya sp. SIO4C1]|nr:hypothetical protein [Leptolyngbya sp. SIO4C1]